MDAGVTVAVGRPGAGKSFYAVRLIVMALLRGDLVLTNVPLVEGWAEKVAVMRGGRFRSKAWRRARARKLEKLLFLTSDVMQLGRIGVPDCKGCRGCKAGRSCVREGRALAVLDEAPKFLDARLWNVAKDGSEGGKPVLDRKKVTDFFRMHRKRGFSVVLITQAESLIDSSVRGMGEKYVLLRNLRRIPHWANLFWYLRMDLFSAVTYWGVPGKAGTIRARSEWFFFSPVIGNLYDTMGGFAEDGSEDPDVWPWGGGPREEPESEAPQRSEDADGDGDAHEPLTTAPGGEGLSDDDRERHELVEAVS